MMHIVKGMDENFADSYCVSCGACVQACPTTAITDIFRPAAQQVPKRCARYVPIAEGCNLDVAKRNGTILSICPYDAEANQVYLREMLRFRFNHPNACALP